MTTLIAGAPPAKNSAPNTAGAKAAASPDKKAWVAEIHKGPEYNGALAMADIVPDPQNRKEHGGLQDLADSIKTEGLLQPIVVRPCPKYPGALAVRHVVDKVEHFKVFQGAVTTPANLLYEGTDKRDADRAAAIYRGGIGWQIIAGERRWAAHRLNKAETIRAFIHRGETDVSAAVKQTIENLGREDLNPIEEAKQMQRLADLKVPQKQIGELFRGRSQPVVANTIKLLQLPPAVQALIVAGKLGGAYGQELVRFAAWPKICTFIAKNIVADIEGNNDNWSAKRLRGEELPFHYALEEEGLTVSIYTGSYGYNDRRSYKMPAELSKQVGFIKTGYDTWTYLLPEDPKAPNLWLPEQKKQDAAAEAAKLAKQEKNEKAKKTGKPTAEQIERKKKLDGNKARRAATEATLAHGLRSLKETKGLHVNALAVICDHVLGDTDAVALEDVAEALGLKLPAQLVNGMTGFGESNELLQKLGAETMIKLAAASIMMSEAEPAVKMASEVPESCNFVAGKAASKAAANSVQVVVKGKGSTDYVAKAGAATASATSAPEHAAKAAAAKHFSASQTVIDLHRVKAGSMNGEPWIYTAMKAEKGGATPPSASSKKKAKNK